MSKVISITSAEPSEVEKANHKDMVEALQIAWNETFIKHSPKLLLPFKMLINEMKSSCMTRGHDLAVVELMFLERICEQALGYEFIEALQAGSFNDGGLDDDDDDITQIGDDGNVIPFPTKTLH